MAVSAAEEPHPWEELFAYPDAIRAESGFELDGGYMGQVLDDLREDIMRVFCNASARHGDLHDGLRALMERAYFIGFIHGHDDYEARYPERIPDDDA